MNFKQKLLFASTGVVFSTISFAFNVDEPLRFVNQCSAPLHFTMRQIEGNNNASFPSSFEIGVGGFKEGLISKDGYDHMPKQMVYFNVYDQMLNDFYYAYFGVYVGLGNNAPIQVDRYSANPYAPLTYTVQYSGEKTTITFC